MMGVISVLLSILLPVLGKVRGSVRAIISTSNQRQVASGVNLFAMDNNERYPESVATIGKDSFWNWTNPTKLTGSDKRMVGLCRAMSEYLCTYIPSGDVMYCPNGPDRYRYLQEVWDAGDEWDNPDTGKQGDPAGGNYCFYWNYVGYLTDDDVPFYGPKSPEGGIQTSNVLMTDYFGYGHWRSPNKFGSCEKFKRSQIISQTRRLSSYWCRDGNAALEELNIKLRAAYTDGSVRTYSAAEIIPMKVLKDRYNMIPYPDGVGGGTYYLPLDASPQ